MSLESPDPPLVSPFPLIADYGFLSDCETCALVAPSGSVEWMCLPRMDSPSVFGAMLDRASGSNTHKRVPSDHDGEKVLIRTVRCLSGSMDLVLECEPGFDYGRQRAVW